MPFRIAIRNLTVYLRYVDLRTVNFRNYVACVFIFARRPMCFSLSIKLHYKLILEIIRKLQTRMS